MNDNVYIDTSALAKWYLNEAHSTEFVKFIQSVSRAIISDLTLTEMRSLLSQRRRMKELTHALEEQIFATFLTDIDQGYLIVQPIENHYLEEATHLIASLPDIPLRTLDALHLTVVTHQHIQTIATADQIMIAAALALQINVEIF